MDATQTTTTETPTIDDSTRAPDVADIRQAEIDGQRQWEAVHSCVNDEHFKYAQDFPINYSTSGDLHILRRRCEEEFYNNPMVEGVVETHTIDLVGECGPTLQVQSDSDRYNSLLEEIFAEWWSKCTVGAESGIDMLRRFNYNDWLRGNSLAQMIGMKDLPSSEIIKMRLLEIAPRRLRDPWGKGLYDRIFLSLIHI